MYKMKSFFIPEKPGQELLFDSTDEGISQSREVHSTIARARWMAVNRKQGFVTLLAIVTLPVQRHPSVTGRVPLNDQ